MSDKLKIIIKSSDAEKLLAGETIICRAYEGKVPKGWVIYNADLDKINILGGHAGDVKIRRIAQQAVKETKTCCDGGNKAGVEITFKEIGIKVNDPNAYISVDQDMGVVIKTGSAIPEKK